MLDHAARLLARDPAVGMAEIAGAAGVGRATLYRHFPTREDLIAAIDARALREVEEAIAAARLEEGSATAAFERLAAPMLALVERGQATGELSRALSAQWILRAFGAVLLTGLREIADGRLERDRAAAVVSGTLLDGLRHA